MLRLNWWLVAAMAGSITACGHAVRLPVSAGTGPDPVLPPPADSLIPTVKIAPAKGWPAGGKPVAAKGTVVTAFADGLAHPRWLYVLPDGDVLVAETNAPPQPAANPGLKGWIMKQAMKEAGAEVTSADRITLLRDTDGDGVADLRSVFLEGLRFRPTRE